MRKAKKVDDGHDDRPEIVELVLSLIRQTNETKTRMQSEAGALGERIKDAVENKHLHAGALKFIARLTRMDAVKGNDFWRAVQLYMDYAIDDGLFGAQSDLVDRAQEATSAQSNGEDAATENVRTLRRGMKSLPASDTPDLPPAA
jgi:hypothetical protein